MAVRTSVSAGVAPLTSFVGRDRSIHDVGRLLESNRLVTLTGAGGCGKTRLAIEVAGRVESTFDDGAVFVDLAPVDSPAVVGSAVASALTVSDSGGPSVAELLVNALVDRHLLLVVDNCERVVDACAALVHRLLSECNRLTVLATSRAPLGVAGEVTWRVPSLSIPPAAAAHDVSAIEESESGRLLVDRARLARPDFVLTSADAPAAVAICRRLDGIPLAIELAASRLRGLDLTEVAKGLEDRFRLLTAGPRTAPPRQRTLEASIDWSYDLLDEPAQILFRRLAVFAAGFTPDAVEDVCSDVLLPAHRIIDLIATLADQSLVNVERSGAQRFRLLETVREYAQLRLAESGEEGAVRDRHLRRVAALTTEFNREADGPGLSAANPRMEPLVGDVRSAIDWSIRSDRVVDGLQIAADLRLFWISTRRNQEGQAWLSELLDADHGDDIRGRTRGLLAAGELSLYARDPLAQIRLASEALESARQLGDGLLEAWALILVGWAKVNVDPFEARSLLVAGRDAAREGNDEQLVEFASYGLGTAAATVGDFDAAHDAFDTGIDIARASRTLDLQYGLGQRGYVELLQGRIDDAIVTLTEATSPTLPVGGDFDRVHRDLAVTWLALAMLYRGRYEEAREWFDEALAIARALGNQSAHASLHLALYERAMGSDADAAARIESMGSAIGALGAWFEVQALVCLGHSTGSADHYRAAMARAETSGNPLARVVAGLGMARLAGRDGDAARGRTLLRTALRTADAAGYRLGVIDAMEAFAVFSVDEAPERAAQLMGAVDAERSRIGYARFPVDRAAYESVGVDGKPESLPFDDAVAVALRGESRPARPPSGWESLTPAEARVATLVAEGLSNPEIGERLFISRRTVQTHISHVFTKLGVGTRAELAAVVIRTQPPRPT